MPTRKKRAKIVQSDIFQAQPVENIKIPAGQEYILTERKLDEILGVNRTELGIKSVSTPPAQLVELCAESSDIEYDWGTILASYKKLMEVSPQLAAIYALLVEGGLRISEVLEINSTQIDAQGKVSIVAKKRSESRIIVASLARPYLLKCKKFGIQPFQDINRFYVYREFKKCNIGAIISGNKNHSITHIGKHLNAMASKKANFDKKQIQHSLGHKSAKSTEYYGI
jgi:integrase-like protein